MDGEYFNNGAGWWDPLDMHFDFSGLDDVNISDEASPGLPREISHQLSTPGSSFLDSNHQNLVAELEAQQQQPYVAAFPLGARTYGPFFGIRSPASDQSYSSPSSSSTPAKPLSSNPNTTIGNPFFQQATCTSPLDNSRSASEIPFQVHQFDPHESIQRTSRPRIPSSQRGRRRDALNDKKPRERVARDARGKLQGSYITFGANETVRRDFDAKEKALTKRTRLLKACFSCRVHKQRCDRVLSGLMPCHRCLQKYASGKVDFGNDPCIRVNLRNLYLHRKGSTETTFLNDWMSHKQASTWSSSSLSNSLEHASSTRDRTVYLTQGIDGLVLQVPVARYAIESDDKTWYEWKDSNMEEHKMNMPPYYISDITSVVRKLAQQFESDSAGNYLSSLLSGEDIFIQEAFREAHRLSKTSTLLAHALRLWCGTRFTELTWTICGGDRLDITPSTEAENPWKDTVPVTPIMDTQLDEIAIKAFLTPHADRFLQQLEHKMKQQNTADWYEVLLALIIVLHNFERIFADVDHYTSRHGIEKLKSRSGPSLSEQNDSACRSLISSFHFGYVGFMKFRSAMASNEDDESLIETERKFVQLLRRFFNETDQPKDWRQRNVYQDSMFWISQIMTSDWNGDFKHVVPLDHLTEKDFLTSQTSFKSRTRLH